jgi:hypothetical protein
MTRCSGRPHFEHINDLREVFADLDAKFRGAYFTVSRCPYRGLQRPVDMPDRGSYWGPVQTVHSAQRGRAKGVRPSNGVDEP